RLDFRARALPFRAGGGRGRGPAALRPAAGARGDLPAASRWDRAPELEAATRVGAAQAVDAGGGRLPREAWKGRGGVVRRLCRRRGPAHPGGRAPGRCRAVGRAALADQPGHVGASRRRCAGPAACPGHRATADPIREGGPTSASDRGANPGDPPRAGRLERGATAARFFGALSTTTELQRGTGAVWDLRRSHRTASADTRGLEVWRGACF